MPERIAKLGHPAGAAVIELVHPDARMPRRATSDSAGADVFAVEDSQIQPRGHAMIPLGFKLTAPEGTYARVAPRSGLALKYMICLLYTSPSPRDAHESRMPSSA